MSILLTITLLIVAGCNIATLWLYIRLKRKIDIEGWQSTQDRANRIAHYHEHKTNLRGLSERLHGLTEAVVNQAATHHLILGKLGQLAAEMADDGKLTRQRIAQVKTRLADEERADQTEKRQTRDARRKGRR